MGDAAISGKRKCPNAAMQASESRGARESFGSSTWRGNTGREEEEEEEEMEKRRKNYSEKNDLPNRWNS